MGALREALQDSSVSRDVKPIVISCFGDIAMAIGAAYEPYLQISVMMLMQAATQRVPPDDEELVAFINSLRMNLPAVILPPIPSSSTDGLHEYAAALARQAAQWRPFITRLKTKDPATRR